MRRPSALLALTFAALFGTSPLAQESPAPPSEPAPQQPTPPEKIEFTGEEVLNRARGFFGETTEGLAKAIEKVTAEYGRPNAIITGEEAGGAIVVGLRYGKGTLEMASGEKRPVYWQGPSVGFDIGGNAAKSFTLVYNLTDPEKLFQRFPGVDGSLYFVAGLSLNYQRSGDVVLAPIRTGVGWRQGANIGYLHYTREKSYVPL